MVLSTLSNQPLKNTVQTIKKFREGDDDSNRCLGGVGSDGFRFFTVKHHGFTF